MSLLLIGGASVVGIIQSTERLGTSGIIVQPQPPPIPPQFPPPSTPPPSPPEETLDVEIYSDSTLNQVLSSVAWGAIEPGTSMNRIMYIQNNGDDSVTLSVTTEDWTPAGASGYLQLSWDYNGSPISPGEVIQITMILDVSSSITGIDTFNFNIVILGTTI